MKLDASNLRYLQAEDFRILSALEAGSRNHELVPIPLISKFTGIRPGGLRKKMGDLARYRLFTVEGEGIRLGYGGYDYLALNALQARGSVHSIGNQIGVGKEADVYLADNSENQLVVVKIQRLGRTSFRTVKSNRDYHGSREHISWLYLSKLAAQREYEFMTVLWERGFSIPKPLDCSRHILVMEWIDGRRLDEYKRAEVEEAVARDWLNQCLDLLVNLARVGLVHGDLNEFNILVPSEAKRPLVMIDFPQMTSIRHPTARSCFERDYLGIVNFFGRVHLVETDKRIDFDDILKSQGEETLQDSLKSQGEETLYDSLKSQGEESLYDSLKSQGEENLQDS